MVLIDQLEEKAVLYKEEETKSSVHNPTNGVVLNTHSVDPRML